MFVRDGTGFFARHSLCLPPFEDAVSRIFAILPAYNEERSLPPLLDSFDRLFKRLGSGQGRIIVVDDGSRDGTRAVLEQHAARMPLDIVVHPKNRGLGEAIKSGLRRAVELARDDDIFVGMDADNTHPPSAIPRMIRLMRDEKADIVIASRYRRGSRQVGVPLRRQILSLGAMVVFRVALGLPGVRDTPVDFALTGRDWSAKRSSAMATADYAARIRLHRRTLVHLATLQPTIREVPFVLRIRPQTGSQQTPFGTTVVETFRMLWRHRCELRRPPRPPADLLSSILEYSPVIFTQRHKGTKI
jgi:dolichol-phosphate mannosyltransferase